MELENGVSFSSVLCGNKRRMSATNKCIGSASETQEEPQNLKSNNNSNTTRKLYQGSLTISKKYTFIIKKSGSCAKNNNKIGVAKTSEVRKLRSSQKMAAWCTFLPALISLLLTSSFLLQPAFSQGLSSSSNLQSSHHESSSKLSKYGCEGETVDIRCRPGTVIHIIRANFGRFSISICNPAGNQNWTNTCMEPRTLRVVSNMCEKKSRCEIPVEAERFGDPCPGTHKYVEVHYLCESLRKAATTPKPRPPWELDLAATPAPLTTSSTASTTTISNNDLNSYLEVVEEETEPEEETYPQSSTGVSLNTADLSESHCYAQNRRGLNWNWTPYGHEAIQVCPSGATGFARWTCKSDGSWSGAWPNLGECQSMWLTRMESRMHSVSLGTMDYSIGPELAALTEDKSLYGGDIPIVTSLLHSTAQRLGQELYSISSQEEKEIRVTELLQNALKTASNLLQDEQMMAWSDLPREKRSLFASNLIIGVEENALLLAETVNNERNLIEATNNILSSIRVFRVEGNQEEAFPRLETVRWETDSEIRLSRNVLDDVTTASNSNGGQAVKLIFYLYNNLELILTSSANNGEGFVNSKVIGVTTNKRNLLLNHPSASVEVKLRHLQPVDSSRDEIACASWNYDKRSWSTSDCILVSTNRTHSLCQCRRLSAFSVLTREKRPSATDEAINLSQPQPVENKSEDETPSSGSMNVTAVAAIAAVLAAVLFVFMIVVIIRHFDLKPRRAVSKLVNSTSTGGSSNSSNGSSNGSSGGIFRCKKSNSSTSSCGFYPPLTASPTSTTVSGGTPTGANSGNMTQQTYIEQVLKAANNEQQQQYATNKKPTETLRNTIYRTSQPQGQRQLVALNGYDPFGHHIYMEIDPVYAHLDAEQQMFYRQQQINNQHIARHQSQPSDIQMSDISSDDDLHRQNGQNSNNGQHGGHQGYYPEERPLIRQQRQSGGDLDARLIMNTSSSSSTNTANNMPKLHQPQVIDPRHFMTSNRLQNNSSGFYRAESGPVRMVQTSQRSSKNKKHQQQKNQNQQAIYQQGIYDNASLVNTGGGSATPLSIALQGNEQFVSLQMDQEQQQQQFQRTFYQ